MEVNDYGLLFLPKTNPKNKKGNFKKITRVFGFENHSKRVPGIRIAAYIMVSGLDLTVFVV